MLPISVRFALQGQINILQRVTEGLRYVLICEGSDLNSIFKALKDVEHLQNIVPDIVAVLEDTKKRNTTETL